MDIIGQNGNEGEHYDDDPNKEKIIEGVIRRNYKEEPRDVSEIKSDNTKTY